MTATAAQSPLALDVLQRSGTFCVGAASSSIVMPFLLDADTADTALTSAQMKRASKAPTYRLR
jgi:hypothetical protein